MKTVVTFLLSNLIVGCAYCQFGDVTHGPVPYRTLEKTIGLEYVLLKLENNLADEGYMGLHKVSDPDFRLSAKVGEGKKLKLVSIDDHDTGHFVDSSGTEYTSVEVEQTYFGDMTLASDLEDARKLLLNKTLWTNDNIYRTGDPYAPIGARHEISVNRFDPVTVVNVLPGMTNTRSIIVVAKTLKGEIIYQQLTVSGTNSDMQPTFAFDTFFFMEDPKLKYHFTPEVWKYVKIKVPTLGMPTQAVMLCEGPPKAINHSYNGNTSTDQWVYGDSSYSRYFYFTNGKLTAIQN